MIDAFDDIDKSPTCHDEARVDASDAGCHVMESSVLLSSAIQFD